MAALILDGKTVSQRMLDSLRDRIQSFPVKPGLAVIRVGQDPASVVYVNLKEKRCKEVGFYSEKYELPETITQKALTQLIQKLNASEKIHGILVQLPLPSPLNEKEVIEAIDPRKDVDGFHPITVGRMAIGYGKLWPCTPLGIITLLREYEIEISGKHAVVVGASNIVGKPTAAMLLNEGATVTVCNSRTKDLPSITKQADILVVAVGKPGLISADMVKQGVVVVDVGITKVGDKLLGDVAFDEVKAKAAAITPVPGGVGPMTVALLLQNTFLAYQLQNKNTT